MRKAARLLLDQKPEYHLEWPKEKSSCFMQCTIKVIQCWGMTFIIRSVRGHHDIKQSMRNPFVLCNVQATQLKKRSYSRTPPNNEQVSAVGLSVIGRFYRNYKVTLPQMCNNDFKYTLWQVQKTFCEKWGRVGLEKSMCTETTKSSQTRLWAGVVSFHAPTSWGWGSIFAIFTSWYKRL